MRRAAHERDQGPAAIRWNPHPPVSHEQRRREARERRAQRAREEAQYDVQPGDLVGHEPCTVIERRGKSLLCEDPEGFRFVMNVSRTGSDLWGVRGA